MRILVKIEKDSNLNKYLMFIKKFTGQGISNIKDKIMNEQYVAAFDSFSECEKASEFINGIKGLGGVIKLYEEYGNHIEEMPLDRFYNLIERNDQIKEDNEDLTEMECTKIIALIDKKHVRSGDSNRVIRYEGNKAVIELDFSIALKDFLCWIRDNNVDAQLYQVELEETQFNEDDKVNEEEIVELISKYM